MCSLIETRQQIKKSTVVQCELCNERIITSIAKLPNECPCCKKENEFSIVSLSITDNHMVIAYIQQEV